MNKLKFKPGKILEEFDIEQKGKRGQKSRNLHVIFRYPRASDLDECVSFINSAITESEFLRLNKKISRTEEGKWLRGTIKGLKEGKKIHVLAEINGRISGSGNVDLMDGAATHVGVLGVSLREKYTGMGIGTRFIELLMNESMKIGVEVVKLSHFDNNKRARHVYDKLGFKHIGKIPRARKNKDGNYSSESLMYKVMV